MKISQVEKRFGKQIAKARREQNLKQSDVSKVTGVSRGQIAMMETGRTRVMLIHAINICKMLNLDLHQLTISK